MEATRGEGNSLVALPPGFSCLSFPFAIRICDERLLLWLANSRFEAEVFPPVSRRIGEAHPIGWNAASVRDLSQNHAIPRRFCAALATSPEPLCRAQRGMRGSRRTGIPTSAIWENWPPAMFSTYRSVSRTYHYAVRTTGIVDPSDTNVLSTSATPTLTLSLAIRFITWETRRNDSSSWLKKRIRDSSRELAASFLCGFDPQTVSHVTQWRNGIGDRSEGAGRKHGGGA